MPQQKRFTGSLGDHPLLKQLKKDLDKDLATRVKRSLPPEDPPKPQPELTPGEDFPVEWLARD